MNRTHRMGIFASVASVGMAFVVLSGVAFAADEEKKEGWTGEIALSVNAQSGSTDTFAGSIDVGTERTFDERDRYRARFNGVYGTTRSRDSDDNTQTIANSQTLSGDWKRSISERFSWLTAPSVARDNTQDLEVRAMFTTGPTYRVWHGENADKSHFDIFAGPGYRFEIYDGNTGAQLQPNPPGGADTSQNGDTDHFADIVVGFEYKHGLFDDKVEYRQTASARMPANDVGAYLLRSEIIFGVPITAAWSFRTGFVIEYVAEPGSDEVNNTTTRTNVGLEYKF